MTANSGPVGTNKSALPEEDSENRPRPRSTSRHLARLRAASAQRRATPCTTPRAAPGSLLSSARHQAACSAYSSRASARIDAATRSSCVCASGNRPGAGGGCRESGVSMVATLSHAPRFRKAQLLTACDCQTVLTQPFRTFRYWHIAGRGLAFRPGLPRPAAITAHRAAPCFNLSLHTPLIRHDFLSSLGLAWSGGHPWWTRRRVRADARPLSFRCKVGADTARTQAMRVPRQPRRGLRTSGELRRPDRWMSWRREEFDTSMTDFLQVAPRPPPDVAPATRKYHSGRWRWWRRSATRAQALGTAPFFC